MCTICCSITSRTKNQRFWNFSGLPRPFQVRSFRKNIKNHVHFITWGKQQARRSSNCTFFQTVYSTSMRHVIFSFLYIHTFIICILYITLRTCWTSGGKTINCELDIRLYIFSMKMPVRIALATDRNEGRSSFDLLGPVSCLAKVDANHLRTSSGTASDCNSDKSSPMVSSL